jgi:hypothetical protein
MVILQNKAELAAEARYEMAASFFRQQQWNASEKAAFETINKSGSYEEWVTRSYLLLGDVYTAQKDYFNARATYRSIYENANREEWRVEAQNKLEELKKIETDADKKGWADVQRLEPGFAHHRQHAELGKRGHGPDSHHGPGAAFQHDPHRSTIHGAP